MQLCIWTRCSKCLLRDFVVSDSRLAPVLLAPATPYLQLPAPVAASEAPVAPALRFCSCLCHSRSLCMSIAALRQPLLSCGTTPPPPATPARPPFSVCSYRRQFQRLRGLLDPQEIQPTALKGSALCYNAATGHLVTFNARQRILSVLMADGSIRSEVGSGFSPFGVGVGCKNGGQGFSGAK